MGTDTGPSGGVIWFGYADPDIEGPEKTYRKRWFRARKIGKEKPRRLVGYDVSASQTQIVATFMGIEAKMTMASSTQIAFKEELARWAYEAHCVTQKNKANSIELSKREKRQPLAEFELRIDLWKASEQSNYLGYMDPRLQNLCKTMWMAASYGGSVDNVVRDQRNDEESYGPGWTAKNAGRFLRHLNRRFPEMGVLKPKSSN